jgi:hypothetical protein
MAGDWIKFEIATPDKAEVWVIANKLNMDPDAVIGKLLRVWIWFDQHSEKGNAPSVTKMLLNRLVGNAYFCDAMIFAGWMHEADDQISLKDFSRHNGKSAKNRANTALRVSAHKKRNDKSNAEGNEKLTLDALPREEKRREEKTVKDILPQADEFEKVVPDQPIPEKQTRATRLPADWIPSQEFFDELANIDEKLKPKFNSIAATFKDYWVAKSGKDATKTDWLATWRNWVRREAENNAKNNGNNKPSYHDRRADLTDAITDYQRATRF